MDRETTRRSLLAAIGGGAAAGGFLGPVRGYLDGFAPLSGDAWRAARDDPPERIESPYGPAALRYDGEAVPRVDADDELAAYFAVGYAQGVDRLFQMDLQRRQMRGELSEVVGEVTLASDRFHVEMDFAAAAAATWDAVAGSDAGAVTEAFCEGVNRAREDLPLPLEFGLLSYEPDPWTPEDVMLAEKQISWGLTGSFRTLRKESLAARLGEERADQLLPDRLDHDAAILGHGGATDDWEPGSGARISEQVGRRPRETDPALEARLAAFEPAPWIGSNSWAVSGEHTDSGAPILANDPHLSLMAPPIWYEQVVRVGDQTVRGVTFPGVPFVVIGENDAGAWGFTNAGADVIDCYEYETRGGGAEYRYGDEWREFDTREHVVGVAGGEDRTVTVRKSVHGSVVGAESDGDEFRSAVGIAWTGLSATRTTHAIRDMTYSEGIDDFEAAVERFDEPTQNCVYADRDGNVLYRTIGKVPIRRTDGDPVAGNRVFDGSARKGEWPGYTPFGESSWDGFIPFEEMPHDRTPDYVGTANQRIVDDADYPHYLAEAYGAPFRGIRLWERLDDLVGDGDVTPADMRELQRDVADTRADVLLPHVEAAADSLSGDPADAAAVLLDWDRRMDRDSRAALVFEFFCREYRREVVGEVLADAMGATRDPTEYYPNYWALAALPEADPWFPDGRAATVEAALTAALETLESEGWETWGEYNRTAIDHQFDRPWLNYPRYPIDGSEATLFNFRRESGIGSSWRQVCPMDGESRCILPGGNAGSAYDEEYHGQLRRWADGEFKPMDRSIRGDVAVRFTGETDE
ncbi:penicillin acylase family protein [Halorarum halobium]|uniref:penicillin acylase family protein n=1 Tax=Halorarum halobium TaxID=3075121 RepID=UPI0028AC4AE5|nr:penicillin acylase family protein [Halobaculum sp. XH14]